MPNSTENRNENILGTRIPFTWLQGTNTLKFNYHNNSVADLGWYYKAGGVYSVTLGKWVKARSMKYIILSKVAPVATMATIEDDNIVINYGTAGEELSRDTIPPTRIK